MEKIVKIVNGAKKTLNTKEYVAFLESIKEICETQLNNHKNEEYKAQLLKIFKTNERMCKFIELCIFNHISDHSSNQHESIFEKKMVIEHENIYITINTSNNSSDDWDDRYDIEMCMGENEDELWEILTECHICCGKTYDHYLSDPKFTKNLKDTLNKIKCDDIDANDLCILIKKIIELIWK